MQKQEKPAKIKAVLEDYGEKMGYDRTGYYQMVLRRFRSMSRDGVDLLEVAGVVRSGGLWVGYEDRLVAWLEQNTKPGPYYDVERIPDDLTPDELIESKGVYQLKETLRALDPAIVTYWKVIGALKRAKNPRKDVGAYLKNGVYVVDMPLFAQWYAMNEP